MKNKISIRRFVGFVVWGVLCKAYTLKRGNPLRRVADVVVIAMRNRSISKAAKERDRIIDMALASAKAGNLLPMPEHIFQH